MANPGNNKQSQQKGRLEYLTSALSIQIIEYTEKHIDNSPVIFYRIKVIDHFSNNNWIIEKRYNDFVSLQKKLIQNYQDVPKLPGKTFFRVSEFADIKKRKDGLQKFLRTCIERKDILANEDFKIFLELPKNSPELCGNSPDLLGSFTLPQGVRDIVYLPNESIILLCTAEMSVIERAETTMKNTIINPDEITNPLGHAYIYSLEDNKGDFIFREIWRRKFKPRTRCLAYDKDENYMLIGRADGVISIFTLDKRSKYKKVDLIIELKPHINSVNGIWYDFIQKKLFTLSSDKRFLASDIKSNSNITEISKSNFGYTCLKVDTKYNRFFTANEGGVIDIYSYKKFPPMKLSSTGITGNSHIRDIYINPTQLYIYACDSKGKISVIDFSGLNNNSSYCPEISQFGGKISLRQIIYDENKKELITGDESGKIIAWGLKTGQPIFSFSGAEGNSAITKLLYDKDIRLLIAGCKNNMVKFWKLPDNWVNVEVQKFEDEELKKINNEIARRRIKAQQEIEDGIENDFDSDLSQEDDLNGWNYRKDK
jgi:WD40 repeat protein